MKLSPAMLAALRLVASGAVSYVAMDHAARFTIRTDTINRATMRALSRRGLTRQEATDVFRRRHVVLTEAGREALAAAEPKETP